MAFKVGSKVRNNHSFSSHAGMTGTVIKFNSGIKGWEKNWSMIRYSDGTESSEMNIYLSKV